MRQRLDNTILFIEEAQGKLLWALGRKRRAAWWRKVAKSLGGELEAEFEPHASMLEGGVSAAKININGKTVTIEAYSKFQRSARPSVADSRRHRLSKEYRFWIGTGDQHEEFTVSSYEELVGKAKAAIKRMKA